MLASTLTTVIVFFPVMFLFGVARDLFGALSLAVVLSMLASYVVAMTVIPVYCAYFLTAEEEPLAGEEPSVPFALMPVALAGMQMYREETGRGRRGLLGAFHRAYERFAARYEHWLRVALDHKAGVRCRITSLGVRPESHSPIGHRSSAGRTAK